MEERSLFSCRFSTSTVRAARKTRASTPLLSPIPFHFVSPPRVCCYRCDAHLSYALWLGDFALLLRYYDRDTRQASPQTTRPVPEYRSLFYCSTLLSLALSITVAATCDLTHAHLVCLMTTHHFFTAMMTACYCIWVWNMHLLLHAIVDRNYFRSVRLLRHTRGRLHLLPLVKRMVAKTRRLSRCCRYSALMRTTPHPLLPLCGVVPFLLPSHLSSLEFWRGGGETQPI